MHVFQSTDEYVSALTRLPTPPGGVICTTYLPSALFPKSALLTLFTRHQTSPYGNQTADALWDYGKKMRRYLSSGACQLTVEASALATFVNSGQVHAAVPQFEVTHHVRADVLSDLVSLARSTAVTVTPGPIPFVFRLVPPTGVLIDVTNNTVEQRVQGMWLDNDSSFAAFSAEASRLAHMEGAVSATDLSTRLQESIERLRTGRLPFWSVA